MRKAAMFLAATVLSSAVLAPDISASAPEYPFCAIRGGRGGSETCGFTSFAQCLDTVRGAGGHCQVNPRFAGAVYHPTGSNEPWVERPRARRAWGERRY